MSKESLVIETIKNVLQNNGLEPQTELSGKTNILSESGLDSLGLAEVIVELEEKTGKDPFGGGFINFQTIEELAKLYESN